MAKPQVAPLQRQLARVSRRLFVQTLLTSLLWSWAGALIVTAGWFLVRAAFFPQVSESLRLWVAGGLLGGGTLLAVLMAILRAPPRLAAALMLDEKFGLKERVTTSLTLAPEQRQSSAAQALLADVNQRIGELDVSTRFPVHVSAPSTLAPLGAAALAVAAFFYQPTPTQATTDSDNKNQPPANVAEIEKKFEQIKKRALVSRPKDKPPSEELKRIDAELDQIANRPRATKEQLKERIKEMTGLEDLLKDREKEMTEKSRALKQQLSQLDRAGDKNGSQDGPAKELQKALSEGKLDQAREELAKLAKKVKEDGLSKKEQEQLAKQLENIQKKMENLAQKKDLQEQLKQLHKEGKLDAEALKREMDQIKKDAEKLKDLQKLAKQLGQCQQCLKRGDNQGATKSLESAEDSLQGMDSDDKNLDDVREQLQRLRDLKDSC
jgi:hypothetical protein